MRRIDRRQRRQQAANTAPPPTGVVSPEQSASEAASAPAIPQRGRRVSPGVPQGVFWLLGTFFILEYSRIPSIFPFIGAIRVQMLLLVALVVCLFRFADKSIWRQPVTKWMFAFGILCGLGILFTPNTRAAFNMMVNILTYLGAVVLPLIAFVKTADRMRWFLGLFVSVAAFVAIWSMTHGGKGPGGFIGDENDCALVLNFALPFAVALVGWPNLSGGQRWFYRVCALLIVLGSIATVSRGGFLGLVAACLVSFWYSKQKMKILGWSAVVVMFSGVLAPIVLPPDYIKEVQSIGDVEDGTRQNRIYFWKLGWMMYKANPVLGVGAGNYPWTVADYERRLPPEQLFRNRYSGGRYAHSLYFTLMPELGTAGVVAYLALLVIALRAGWRLRKSARDLKETDAVQSAIHQRLGTAIIASLAAFSVTAAFISVLYYPCFWHLVGIAAASAALAAPPAADAANTKKTRRRGAVA
jgi:O-antigen ligase